MRLLAVLLMTLVAGAQAAPMDVAHDVGDLLRPVGAPGDLPGSAPVPGNEEPAPPIGDPIGTDVSASWTALGFLGVVAALAGAGGFLAVTRYVSPREALKNPQRAMLYGFVRGHPGVHLKRLSEEFAMKTSSILWHMRKLEAANLVHNERANGFRVFYPVEGGVEVKRVSRGITALQNPNARRLLECIERHPGQSPAQLSDRLGIHVGTVRWHLRKLREFGLVEELVRDDGSLHFPTPLGLRTLQTMLGTPVTPVAGTPVQPVTVAGE
jgi:DNA-binding transcriptional ArsR family regulator